ncbi:ATP-dependent zinc protease [Paralimibaculum aggregatum]|uniref:ATP-dependent zinc protease n=1 Tax=Paralimibaculum aggregatum TaxID=3036245 RepID=A0ABQ6LU67_9RHOB|nr:RimK/LysX family protein [Limibaculum sp. NKW23]GMG85625.1 ATP-dependent zinc protease [Limibaculum sp. NKW23]
MKTSPGAKKERRTTEIGWREYVSLPDIGIASMAAKIDTGARTSALHTADHELLELDGERWIEFSVPSRRPSLRTRVRLLDERSIKNTSGIAEQRPVIRTTLILARRKWHIELSLADREEMKFDLILGRTAIRDHSIVVNPGRSFVLGHPGASKKNKEGATNRRIRAPS